VLKIKGEKSRKNGCLAQQIYIQLTFYWRQEYIAESADVRQCKFSGLAIGCYSLLCHILLHVVSQVKAQVNAHSWLLLDVAVPRWQPHMLCTRSAYVCLPCALGVSSLCSILGPNRFDSKIAASDERSWQKVLVAHKNRTLARLKSNPLQPIIPWPHRTFSPNHELTCGSSPPPPPYPQPRRHEAYRLFRLFRSRPGPSSFLSSLCPR